MTPERLYNVRVAVVDLVWATSEQEAIQKLRGEIIGQLDVDVWDEGSDAFISEPNEQEGWDGEKRVQADNG